LNIGTLPDISAGNDQVICQGDSVLLDANGGASYQWSNGAINGDFIYPTQSITLGVTGFSGEGCSNTDSMTITVNNSSQSTITANGIDVYTLNGINYTASGTYTQIIPNSVGCDSTITLVLSMEYTGLSEGNLSSLNVYPNPSNGDLFIQVPTALIGQTATLTDISGKKIATIQLSEATSKVNLNGLSYGTYFIVMDKHSLVPVRVVKE
jgi:hypothetical protein